MSVNIGGGQYATNFTARAVADIKTELVRAQQEATTGTVHDPARTLGVDHGRSVSLLAQADRLDAIAEANGLTSARLEASATNIARFGALADGLTATFVSAAGSIADRALVQALTAQARAEMTATLNASSSGAHLFAGVTSDQPPVADGAAALATLEARFVSAFGHASSDPATAAIPPAALAAFAADAVDHMTNAGWTDVSSASPFTVNARIAPGETATVSVSSDEPSFRQGYAAALVGEHLFASAASDGALASVASAMLSNSASAAAGSALLEGQIGLTQSRVTGATQRLGEDADLLRGSANDILAVDPFEAAQRFNATVTQLESAYALTARLQSLTILRFL